MCEYCEKSKNTSKKVAETEFCELMENMPIIDEFTEKEIIADGNNPVQYIRRYKHMYFLVTEFADDEGNVILLPIKHCPICGRKL